MPHGIPREGPCPGNETAAAWGRPAASSSTRLRGAEHWFEPKQWPPDGGTKPKGHKRKHSVPLSYCTYDALNLGPVAVNRKKMFNRKTLLKAKK